MCWPISFSRAVSMPAVFRKWSMCLGSDLPLAAAAFRFSLTAFDDLPRAPFFFVAMCTLLVAVHVGTADGVLGAGERDHGEGRGLHREGREVLRLQRMHVRLAAGAG